jgi:hypothetical protein
VTGASDSGSLNDNAKDEDTSVDQNCVFTRDDFCKEAGVDRAQPCTLCSEEFKSVLCLRYHVGLYCSVSYQFENRHQPTHLRRVLSVATHVFIKGFHYKDSSKDSLIIPVEET